MILLLVQSNDVVLSSSTTTNTNTNAAAGVKTHLSLEEQTANFKVLPINNNNNKNNKQGLLRPSPLLRRVLEEEDDAALAAAAQENCETSAKMNQDVLKDIRVQCRCEDSHSHDGVALVCVDHCAYCNDDKTLCGIQSAQALYDEDTGMRTAVGGVFQYLGGHHDDTLAVENRGCTEIDGQVSACETCHVYVNGQECTSCQLKECSDGTRAEVMDCRNVEPNAEFDFCNDDLVIPQDSVFAALSPNKFEDCLALTTLGPLLKQHPNDNNKDSKKSSKKISSMENFEPEYDDDGEVEADWGGSNNHYVDGEAKRTSKKVSSRRRRLRLFEM